MKFSKAILIIGGTVSGVIGQGFRSTCRDVILYPPHTVGAECKGVDGQYKRRSFLDLNACLITSYGWLYFQESGNAFFSCANPELKDTSGDNWTIGAWCPDDGSKSYWEWSEKNMNEIIANSNGQLRCYNQYGGNK